MKRYIAGNFPEKEKYAFVRAFSLIGIVLLLKKKGNVIVFIESANKRRGGL